MPQKTAVFTTTTDWPVPATVSAVWAMWLAGGAGGAPNPGVNLNDLAFGCIGGGGGEYTVGRMLSVPAGGTVSIVIGAGGTAGVGTSGALPTAGGASSVEGYVMLGGRPASGSYQNNAYGGGPNGGVSFFSGSSIDNINNGSAESSTCFGGCGAGLGAPDGFGSGQYVGADGKIGQVVGQWTPTPGAAVPGCHGGGGSGAPSILGVGGTGGSASDSHSGAGWAASGLGAGGGGACGTGTCAPVRHQLNGGAGSPGYAVLMWTEPT